MEGSVSVVTMPVLDRVLEQVKEAMIFEAFQDGGPSLNKVLEISAVADADPHFKRVLETKGGEVQIRIRMIPVVGDNEEVKQQMAALRSACGIATPGFPPG